MGKFEFIWVSLNYCLGKFEFTVSITFFVLIVLFLVGRGGRELFIYGEEREGGRIVGILFIDWEVSGGGVGRVTEAVTLSWWPAAGGAR